MQKFVESVYCREGDLDEVGIRRGEVALSRGLIERRPLLGEHGRHTATRTLGQFLEFLELSRVKDLCLLLYSVVFF